MKTEKQSQNRLLYILVAAVVIGGVAWLVNRPAPEPKEPDGYYTGVRLNRNTGKYVDADGHIVAAPPGEVAASPVPKLKTE